MVSLSAPSQRVVARDLQERGIRNQSYIVAVAYGRICRREPPGLHYVLDVEYQRSAADRRRRELDADRCLPPPTWT